MSSAPDLETSILIRDPCLNPFDIRATAQTDPPEYFYTAAPALFTTTPFYLDPPICDITYKCAGIQGPDPNVSCADATTTAFDEVTGEFSF